MSPRRRLETASPSLPQFLAAHQLTENRSTGMYKNRRPREKNIQSQQVRSSIAAGANALAPETSKKPSAPSQEPIARPRTRAQKRKRAAEDEHSQKRLRKDPLSALIPAAASQDPVSISQNRGRKPLHLSKDERSNERRQQSALGSQFPLSEENLKKLESLAGSDAPNKVSYIVTTSDRMRKRAPSRQTSTSDTNQDTVSQRSTISNTHYRYAILSRARIYIHPLPPPENIQSELNIIFKREIPERKKDEIVDIAKRTSQRLAKVLLGANREDDLIEQLVYALQSMDKDSTFNFPRKADWNPSLKPTLQEGFLDMNIFVPVNNEADNRPSKRQQIGSAYPSPDASRSVVPPPPTPPQSREDPGVKTPRPDFTVGFHNSTIVNALISRGLSQVKADEVLSSLQERGLLYSDPTQNFLNVRFPVLVIEGKAYATGKTAFEAQNQAAVSGSSMINLQQQFADLVRLNLPEARSTKTPLAFSICTEGPSIEFWVHYALSEDNVRYYYMNIFRTCYGSLQGGLEDVLLDIERLMGWLKEEYLTGVVDQLYKLANHAARR